MRGRDYEQFVRAVLVRELKAKPTHIKPAVEAGVTFPGEAPVQHHIDLVYLDERDAVKYVTLIECKYRESGRVTKDEIAALALKRSSARASKAMMVTNVGFVPGALALAKSERIALLVITPGVKQPNPPIRDTHDLYNEMDARVEEGRPGYTMKVIAKGFPGSGPDLTDRLAPPSEAIVGGAWARSYARPAPEPPGPPAPPPPPPGPRPNRQFNPKLTPPNYWTKPWPPLR